MKAYGWRNCVAVCTVEVWKWTSNSIPNFMMDIKTYPCWDES